MSEFRIVEGYFGPRVEAKLHKMRKPRRYSVMPQSDGQYLVQAENSIGIFDPATGKGRLNVKGENFPHLHYVLGAFDYEFPADFVTLCKEVCLTPGEETTRGGVTLVHTVEVI